jgi:hypothetical protein
MYLLFPLLFPDIKSTSDPKFMEAFGKSYLGRPFILLLKMLPHAGIEKNFLYHQLKMVGNSTYSKDFYCQNTNDQSVT